MSTLAHKLTQAGLPAVAAQLIAAESEDLSNHADEHVRLGMASIVGSALEVLPTSDVSMWNTDMTAGVTVAVDNTVKFQGRPTLRVTIPAALSGTIKIGTNIANARLPYGYDRSNFAMAIMTPDVNFSSFGVYVGDASYTNFWIAGGTNHLNFPELKQVANEWMIFKPTVAQWSATGSPAIASQMRCKLQWNGVSARGQDTVLYIGFVGILPKRPKPTIVFTFDDGYASWYSFIRPLMKHYRLPGSYGISSEQVGGGGMMTVEQIQDLHNDPSQLFDIVNHSTNNDPHDVLGAPAYYANVVKCREFLRGIGIDHDGPNHHPYVQSQWSNQLRDLLIAGGFLTARASLFHEPATKDQLVDIDTQFRDSLNICSNVQTGKSVAQAQADVNAVKAAGGVGFINLHDFGATDGAYKWSYDNMQQFVGWVAAERDAGNIEVKSWSRWYADLTGRFCPKK